MENGAPLIELKLATNLRRYERIKLALMSVVLCLNLGIGGYLIGINQSQHRLSVDNHHSLVILECAITASQPDSHGNNRSPAETRVIFNQCIAKG